MSNGLSLIACVGGLNCQLPVSWRRMQRFCSLDWVVVACLLLLAVWLVLAMWPFGRVCLACISGAISDVRHIICERAAQQ